jgi:MYXO-CTERM domain-containing protein
MHRFGLAFWASIVWLSASWFLANEASAYCRLTTADPSAAGFCSTEGRGLAWDRQCISYTVVPRAGGDLSLEVIRDVIDESFDQWLDVDCSSGKLPIMLGQTAQLGMCTTAQYNRYGPNANTIMFLDTWEGEDFPPEAFGLTLVWHDPKTGKIFDADMQLNETIAPIVVCGENNCNRDVDLANVVTHEAGHFLGLGHSNVIGATMSANAQLDETSKRSLEQDDREGICSIYGREPRPECNEQAGDFSPDRGFTQYCGSDEIESSGCACSTPRATHSPSGALVLAGAACALVAWRRRRR